MRFHYLVLGVLLLSACGGRRLNEGLAKRIIADATQASIQDNDAEVIKITQASSTEAIVETQLRTAFRIEKAENQWTVREVRLGHGQWERVDNLEKTLNRIKIEETERMLDCIADAILRYRNSTGKPLVFKDYVSLSDLLSPQYLTPLIRLDAWRRPFEAEISGDKSIRLRSAGPDGVMGTKDDISRLAEN